jgi:hypothetical protein
VETAFALSAGVVIRAVHCRDSCSVLGVIPVISRLTGSGLRVVGSGFGTDVTQYEFEKRNGESTITSPRDVMCNGRSMRPVMWTGKPYVYTIFECNRYGMNS